MNKLLALVLSLVLLMTASAVFAEEEAPGEVLMGQVEFAAHGDRGFAVITVALQDDVILGAKIDEFQFMGDREDLKAVGVPNSDGAFGEAYPEGQVLGSKRANSDLYSLNMQRAGSTVQIAANFDAIEAFAKGKTVAELEAFVNGYTEETKAEVVDAVSGATTADTWGYLRGILAAAEAAKASTGTYTFFNKTGETITELYLVDNLTGEKGVNYAVNGLLRHHPDRLRRGNRSRLQHDRVLQDRGRLRSAVPDPAHRDRSHHPACPGRPDRRNADHLQGARGIRLVPLSFSSARPQQCGRVFFSLFTFRSHSGHERVLQ